MEASFGRVAIAVPASATTADDEDHVVGARRQVGHPGEDAEADLVDEPRGRLEGEAQARREEWLRAEAWRLVWAERKLGVEAPSLAEEASRFVLFLSLGRVR